MNPLLSNLGIDSKSAMFLDKELTLFLETIDRLKVIINQALKPRVHHYPTNDFNYTFCFKSRYPSGVKDNVITSKRSLIVQSEIDACYEMWIFQSRLLNDI